MPGGLVHVAVQVPCAFAFACPDKICKDGDVGYTIINLPSGVTVTSWSTDFALGISGSNTGSTVLVHYIITTPFQHGKGIVRALLSNGTSVSKLIHFKEDLLCL